MISAFGVVHKSFRKLEPKLVRSLKGATEPDPNHTMDQRVRHNYAMFRGMSGGMRSKRGKAEYRAFEGEPTAGEWKAMARTQVTAAGNLNKPKRKLP